MSNQDLTMTIRIVPTVVPVLDGELYRLKPRFDGRPGGNTLASPPATEALLDINPNGALGNINVFKLESMWVEWLRQLNTVDDNERAWNYIQVPHSGIFNASPDNWYEDGLRPTYNAVGFDGNVVKKKRIDGNWMYIETIRVDLLSSPPPFTFYTHRYLIHEFTAVNRNLHLSKAGNGLFVQCPLFSNQEVALPLNSLELWTPNSPPLP